MAEIVFKVNGQEQRVGAGGVGPEVSLNEYLRGVLGLRGTKVMCAEGGCGVCLVSVTAPAPASASAPAAAPLNGEMRTFAVNSCLVSVLSCHGWEVTTVEGVGNRTKGYHQLQRRLAAFNGTQCGYCTPGWVTNMYSLLQSKKEKLTSKDIENSFAGNICRCTGYRPIADAFKTFALDAEEPLKRKLMDLEDLDMFKLCGAKCEKNCGKCKENHLDVNTTAETDREYVMIDRYKETNDKEMIVIDAGDHKWYKAYNLGHVFEAMKNGDYKLIAGNTGQGVYHVDSYPKNVIDIQNVSELLGHRFDVNLILGAGMPLQDMMELFLKLSAEKQEFFYLKQMYDHMDLVAHIPVRNIGTIGGNLCLKNSHPEFQSDVFLLFETVGAMVTIAEAPNKTSMKTMPEFLKVDFKGKVLLNVLLPPLSDCCVFKSFKIMPRSQNAHALVNAGFLFQFRKGSSILDKASIVYGSISPTFIHASKTETLLEGKDPYTEETLEKALKSLEGEIVPVEAPPEPSAPFRKMLAISLYYKAILSLCPQAKMPAKFHSGGDVMKRATSKGTQTFDTDKSLWPLNQPVPKLEALVQCAGESNFANDQPAQVGELFAKFVTADINPGSVLDSFDPSEALKLPGVVAFYSAKDIPGKNSFTPTSLAFMVDNEKILADKEIQFYGQPVGIIAADKQSTASRAAKLVKIKYKTVNKNKPLITIDDVLKSKETDKRVHKDATIEPKEKGDDVKKVIVGEFEIGSQYHFTMETQTCVVKPTEDGMEVYSATQWMDLTAVAIAQSLNLPVNSINVIVRRLGGGYGGKITRATQVACAAALVSRLQGRVCRLVMSLEDNMRIVGKRLPTKSKFEVGVNDDGVIQYLKNTFYQDAGCSFNESIAAFTAHHMTSCYDNKRWFVEANSVATDTPSNTWCRAPASTEGVAMIEHIMDKIAHEMKKDPIEVRRANMAPNNNPLPEMIDTLKMDCNYGDRKEEIKKFNENNRWRKRALELIPLNYGLFYFGNFNSVISIYHSDGTVVLTHGGIEMGQGINTKAAQVCAYKLGIPLDKVSVKPSASFTSPNSVATGGSIGSDCVSFATVKACDIINERLKPIKEKFKDAPWETIVEEAHKAGVDLQASYMVSNDKQEIAPYEVYAVCALELEVDILTGNHDVTRVDLLEDVGRSLSPEIDIGQMEGAFVMGLGYWTSEQMVYDSDSGKLLTDRTWTYKPPGIKDIPADFRLYFQRNARNQFGVLQSKATGEPPLCLAVVVAHALRAAVRAARLDARADHADQWTHIENPCTVENIFTAVGHSLDQFRLTAGAEAEAGAGAADSAPGYLTSFMEYFT